MKDLIGAFCSALCVVHCLLLPAVLATGLPLAGLAWFSGEQTHRVLSLLIILLAVWAFPVGWLRHRKILPGVVALCGIALLLLTAISVESLEAILATIAGGSLISAHLINRHFLLKIQQKAIL